MTSSKTNLRSLVRSSSMLCAVALFGTLSSAGCAATTPKELADARDAYKGAANGPAARYSPAQLHVAHQSLKLAEQTFEEEGDSAATRDRAYVAMRKAQRADTEARTNQIDNRLATMGKRAEVAQVNQLKDAQGALAASAQNLKESEARAAAAALELARLANVKQEERGMVITLSGSVLFASNKAELLPAAQQRLTDVARALKESDGQATMVVEGHTDAKGSADHNLELSARRAEAVRTYLISQGIASDHIRAEGLGFTRPIAENKTAEGRANNRRVEIVVQPASSRAGT